MAWRRFADEVTAEPSLSAFAWAVLATHVTCWLFFVNTNGLNILATGTEPLCWPYFQDCWRFRLDSVDQVAILIVVYLALILASAFALAGGHVKTFWFSLVALNVFLFSIVSLDYRFRANEFYMLFWLNAIFLFWPAKRWAIPLIVVSFYFWAGTLKLNYEWLSGAVLYHDLIWIPPRLAWAACAYVVVLEMGVIWGLLARRGWIRWIALVQFALFHIESLSQIHWFYPLLMAAILSWFVIDRVIGGAPAQSMLADLIRGRTPRGAYILLAVFAGFQLMPYLYRGDKALTGQGRVLALHMFEARQVCDVSAVIHDGDAPPQTLDLKMAGLAPRMICDPIVYYDRARNLCRANEADANFDVNLTMKSRRTTDTALRTIIDEPSFCGRRDRYSVLFNNSWMK